MKKTVVAFGNPLLDTTIYPGDKSLLNKYDLVEDQQQEIDDETMKRLCGDIVNCDKFQTAGGCAQNTLRVMQWLTGKGFDAVIFGSVGRDEEAKTLRGLLETDGVTTSYTIQAARTGRTIAIITGIYRTLVAHIGAAEILSIKDLQTIDGFEETLLGSDYVYIEGFFLTKRVDTARFVLDFCNKHDKRTVFSLGAPYLCQILPETVKYFIDHSDIVVGNKKEFETLRDTCRLKHGSDLIETFLNRDNPDHTIVITDGSNPIIYGYGGRKVSQLAVEPMDKGQIMDTTGSGDAFTAGLLTGMCRGKNIEECIRIGCFTARHIIKQVGCSMPGYEPPQIDN